jgi:hypothetical protein
VDPGDPIVLSETDMSEPAGLFAEGDRVFVAIADDSVPNAEHAGVRVVSGDLSLVGPIEPVIQHGFITGLDSGFGHRAVVGVDADLTTGCAFASLAADGSTAAVVPSVDAYCGSLVATPSGYAALSTLWMHEAGVVSILFLDAGGTFVGGRDVAPGTPRGLVRFDDGSFLILWASGGQSWAQHLGETGDVLADPVETPANAGGTSFGSTALLVWNVGPTIHLRSVDEDGTTVAENVIHAEGAWVLTPNIVPAKQGALVVWTATSDTPWHEPVDAQLYAQPITAAGALDGDLLVVPAGDPRPGVAGAGTAHGALLVYGVNEYDYCGDHSCDKSRVMARSLCHE